METPQSIGLRSAPTSLLGVIATLGPAWITAATVIGGGELMTVPKLGAQAGPFLLWVIVLSCLVKVPMQYVFARHVMHTGKGTMEILNGIPFRRLILGYWLVMQIFTLVQLSGTLQGLGQLLSRSWPGISPLVFAFLLVLTTIALLLRGSYMAVDVGSIVMVIAFTIFTVGCAVLLQGMPEWSITTADIGNGLKFGLPPENTKVAVATALAVFGMTGMAATDVISYPYWIKAAGWSDAVGRPQQAGQHDRMRSWLRLLKLNVLSGCVIYTVPTVALYLLGATVLYRQHLDPTDSKMIDTLSAMYVPVLGKWTWLFFLIGAFSVLYSTLLGASGGHAMVQADFVRVVAPSFSEDRIKRITRLFYIFIPIFTFIVMLLRATPVTLMLLGGMMQALMLPLLAMVSIWLHYSTRSEYMQGRRFASLLPLLLWTCAALMAVVVGLGFIMKWV